MQNKKFTKCKACDANVELSSNNSGTCAFCGDVTYDGMTQDSSIVDVSKITSKPIITEPRFYTERVIPNGENEIRVDGGVKNLATGKFRPDIEKKEGYYTLSLRNLNITNLDDVFDWFSDSELGRIEELDISKNKISDISKVFDLKSLKILRASDNLISDLPVIEFNEEREATKKANEAIKFLNSKLGGNLQNIETNKSFHTIDLRNNRIKSYSNLYYLKTDALLLSGNMINTIEKIINLPLTFDLSQNQIEDISGLQHLVNHTPLKSFSFTYFIALHGNPITNLEDLKNVSVENLSINEYDSEIYDPQGLFGRVRGDSSYFAESALKEIFKLLNERKFYISLDDIPEPPQRHKELLKKDVPGRLSDYKKSNYKFLVIERDRQYDYNEISYYFKPEIKPKVRGGLVSFFKKIFA